VYIPIVMFIVITEERKISSITFLFIYLWVLKTSSVQSIIITTALSLNFPSMDKDFSSLYFCHRCLRMSQYICMFV